MSVHEQEDCVKQIHSYYKNFARLGTSRRVAFLILSRWLLGCAELDVHGVVRFAYAG